MNPTLVPHQGSSPSQPADTGTDKLGALLLAFPPALQLSQGSTGTSSARNSHHGEWQIFPPVVKRVREFVIRIAVGDLSNAGTPSRRQPQKKGGRCWLPVTVPGSDIAGSHVALGRRAVDNDNARRRRAWARRSARWPIDCQTVSRSDSGWLANHSFQHHR